MVSAGNGQIVFNYELCKQYLGSKYAQIFISGEELTVVQEKPSECSSAALLWINVLHSNMFRYVRYSAVCYIYVHYAYNAVSVTITHRRFLLSQDRPTVQRTPNDSVAEHAVFFFARIPIFCGSLIAQI